MTIKRFAKGLRAAVGAFASKNAEAPRHAYLFQSRQMADLCSHFTPAEDADFTRMCQFQGFAYGLAICVPGFVYPVFGSASHFWSVLAGQLGRQLVIVATLLPVLRKHQRAFLASTTYAKSRGLTAASIRFFDFKRP